MLGKLKIIFVLSLLLFSSISFAEDIQLELEFVGYGSTYEKVIVSFYNAGDKQISDITVYIDGSAYKTIEGISSPHSKFEDIFYLEEGEHVIEVRTPEGAYDKITVSAKTGEVPRPEIKPPGTVEDEEKEETDVTTDAIVQSMFGLIVVFVIVLLVVIWLQKGKKKK